MEAGSYKPNGIAVAPDNVLPTAVRIKIANRTLEKKYSGLLVHWRMSLFIMARIDFILLWLLVIAVHQALPPKPKRPLQDWVRSWKILRRAIVHCLTMPV